MLIQIIAWIIFGAITGWIVGLTTRTKETSAVAPNVVIGIIGAIVSGFIISNALTSVSANEFSIVVLMSAVAGSILVLAIIKGFNQV